MHFEINKKNTVEKFRDYVKKFDDRSDQYDPEYGKKTKTPTNYYVLDRIRSLYQWVLQDSMLNLRHFYIHDDDEFKKIKGDVENFIRNKIRSRSDGTIYLKVGSIEFNGSKEQYKEYIVKNRSKLLSVIRKIVDDLNSFFAGEDEKDSNKPILNDINIVKEEEVEQPVEEPEVESTEEVVEEDKEIFIETDLNFKSILEEMNNENEAEDDHR